MPIEKYCALQKIKGVFVLYLNRRNQYTTNEGVIQCRSYLRIFVCILIEEQLFQFTFLRFKLFLFSLQTRFLYGLGSKHVTWFGHIRPSKVT